MATTFAIMRFKKLKGSGSSSGATASINGAVSHIARSRPTPNADTERRHLNRAIVGKDDAQAIQTAIADRTPERYRRDAVRALEFVITASPEWFAENPDQVDPYFDSAVEWLRSHFGAENVVSAIQHNDESTPHMHALVVPVDPETGRLNAKKWLGGRGVMRAMQSEFADHQASYGVERGKARPGRQHTSVADWYNGHAQLDEREAQLAAEREAFEGKKAAAIEDLCEREETLIERETAFEAKRGDVVAKIEQREQSVEKRSQSLSEREQGLANRLVEMEAEKRETARLAADMATRAAALDQRETEAAEQQAAEAARLDRLRSELEARDEQLAGREQELQERAEEIRAIDKALEEKKRKTAEQEDALEDQIQGLQTWASRHRPDRVDDLAGMGRPLYTSIRRMVGDAAADWHEAELDKPAAGPKGPG